MSQNIKIAKPYAQALYEYVSADKSIIQSWTTMLENAASLISCPDIVKLINNPYVMQKDILSVILDCFLSQESEFYLEGFTKHMRNFLMIVAEHKRISILGDIYEQFMALINDAAGKKMAVLVSAITLAKKDQDKFAEKLSQKFGGKYSIDTQVDPDIVGGIAIEVDDVIYDASIKGQLVRLRNYLTA